MNTHDWKPASDIILEPSAEGAVRELAKNVLVGAGPGAGKTELLAQRACFLLQTGECQAPYRILAISFKRDAAKNLRDRVRKRCGAELSERFDSYTFDAFGKSLVDRFRTAIPDYIRPSSNYHIIPNFDYKKVGTYLRDIPTEESELGDRERATLGTKQFFYRSFLRKLEVDQWRDESIEMRAAHELWKYLVKQETSALGFPMIGRLAELLLRVNPKLVAALQQTYRYLFLDEFQDTTRVNYDLVVGGFVSSTTRITSVGDPKQRVMGWAGAHKNVFTDFIRDFAAISISLMSNYRSTKYLVQIQNAVAKTLDPNAPRMVAAGGSKDENSECQICLFANDQEEAQWVSLWIGSFIGQGVDPRDVCILSRIRVSRYSAALQAELARIGIKSRVEDEFQDLLSEPLCDLLLAFLKLAVRDADAEAWTHCNDVLDLLSVTSDDRRKRRRCDEMSAFIMQLQAELAESEVSYAEATRHFSSIIEFVGEVNLRILYPQYAQDEWYQKLLETLAKALNVGGSDWSSAISNIEGMDTIPIMSIHKSKGLEYHAVVLLGLEDNSHFGYRQNPQDEICTLFVALSRAKCRMLFTYSGVRSGARQGRIEIRGLYEMLNAAGVPTTVAT